jgi:hypothetical protein
MPSAISLGLRRPVPPVERPGPDALAMTPFRIPLSGL